MPKAAGGHRPETRREGQGGATSENPWTQPVPLHLRLGCASQSSWGLKTAPAPARPGSQQAWGKSQESVFLKSVSIYSDGQHGLGIVA